VELDPSHIMQIGSGSGPPRRCCRRSSWSCSPRSATDQRPERRSVPPWVCIHIGGILEMFNARLFRFWADLSEALRTSRPQNEVKHTGKQMFEELYADPGRLEQFMHAMAGISMLNFEAFAQKFEFSSYHSLCDVGGATGQLSIIAAQHHPHLRCTSFDLPIVEPIARRTVDAAQLSDRVQIVSGDFFADPLPKADVITMGMILHDWNLDKKMQLIKAAFEALPSGGAFVVIENIIDDARRENVFGLMMSLNHAHRVRRRLRLHRGRFQQMVQRGRLQESRDPAPGRSRQRRSGLQVAACQDPGYDSVTRSC
jgi:precorrin-6B methylase 2